jgi:hypothetical protein
MTEDTKKPQFSPRLTAMKAIAEAAGFKEAPPDHPIYREGPSISFIRLATNRPKKEKTHDAEKDTGRSLG